MSVTLHRCPAPTNRLCACGRVARELSKAGQEVVEVREPWRRRRRDAIRELTGQDHVPVVVLDDDQPPICDSRRIVEHLRWRAETA